MLRLAHAQACRLSTARESRKFSSLSPHPRVAHPRQSTQARNPPGQCTARRNTDRFEVRASRASALSFAPCESRSLRSPSVAPRRNRNRVRHHLRITSNMRAHSLHRQQAHNLRSRISPKMQASQSGVAMPEEVKSAPQIHDGSWRQFVCCLRHRCREPETSLPPRG